MPSLFEPVSLRYDLKPVVIVFVCALAGGALIGWGMSP